MDGEFKIDTTKAISKTGSIFKGNKYRITILSDVLIRFEYDESGIFCDSITQRVINRDFEVPKFEVKEDNKFLFITNKYFKLEYTKEKPFEGTKVMPDANLRVSLVNTDKVWYYKHPEVRNFYGSAYSLDDSSGKVTFRKGLYSTDGFSTIDDSNSLTFDQNGNIYKRSGSKIDLYLFIYRKDFGLALKSYFELTGYPSLIPRYTLGIWWNKNQEYSEADIFILNENFKKHEIPYSVLLLGNNWHTKEYENFKNIKTGFSFNKQLISSPYPFIERLHKNNVFLGLNINTSDGIYPHEEQYEKIASYLNQTDKKVIPINIYDIKMREVYLKLLINPLEALGVDLFWIDNNNKKDLNNLFYLNYYTYNNYNKNAKRRAITFSRNPGISPHRYPILYSGETIVDWQTLKLLPYFNSTASNIGVSWWSHDIGGYKEGIEDSELYMRYVQLGVYSPIFRFSSKEGRYYKREPWLWDVKTLKIVKDYTQIRHRLIPYIYTEAYKYSKTGSPLIQPLYYKYPETYDEPNYKNEYYFGTELFVSPITEAKDKVMNRAIHRLFLPNGMWYDFKTGKKFVGGKRYVTFFKDEDYPVFAKSGSIIPMSVLEINNLNDTTPPQKLEIHVFPGRSNTYTLFEDDGISSLYKEGYYIITNIDYNYRENNYTLIIRPVEGKSGIIPQKRDYKIRFRNTKYADDVDVYVDSFKASHKKYTSDEDFIVEVEDVSTTSQLTINCKGKDIEIDAVRIINEEIDSIINDLQIETGLKEKIANIIFSNQEIKKKRIAIRKLKRNGLEPIFIRMFIRLLEYIGEL